MRPEWEVLSVPVEVKDGGGLHEFDHGLKPFLQGGWEPFSVERQKKKVWKYHPVASAHRVVIYVVRLKRLKEEKQ